MSSGVIGDSLDGRSLTGSRRSVEHETKSVRHSAFLRTIRARRSEANLVPFLVIQEEVQTANHLGLLLEEDVLERTSGHKLELIVKESALLINILDLGDKVELTSIHFILHERLQSQKLVARNLYLIVGDELRDVGLQLIGGLRLRENSQGNSPCLMLVGLLVLIVLQEK